MIIEGHNMQKKHNPLSNKAAAELEETKRRYGRFGRLWRREHYRRDLLTVYRDNARDLYQSMRLAAVLAPLQTAEPIAFPVANDAVGDAPQHPAPDARSSMGAHRDQILRDSSG